MGIDAGVLVIHQITDETTWQLVMRKLQAMFALSDWKKYCDDGAAAVRTAPEGTDRYEPICQDENLASVLMSTTLFAKKFAGMIEVVEKIVDIVYRSEE